LMLRVDAHDLGGGISLSVGTLTPAVPDQVFLVDSTIKRIKTTAGAAGPQASYLMARRMGVLGTIIDDTTQGDAQHLVRVAYAERAVFSHNVLKNSHSGREMFAIRGVCSDGTCGPFGVGGATQFMVVSSNKIETNSYVGIQVDNAASNVPGFIRDIVLEGNWYKNTATGGLCTKIRALRVTVRNEICDQTSLPNTVGTGFQVYGPMTYSSGVTVPGASDVWLYNNTFYSGGQQVNMILASLMIPPVNNLVIRNNIVYGVKATTSYIVTGSAGSTVVQGTNGTTNPSFAVFPFTQPSDLRLTSGSYAIGTGAAVPVFTNFFGQPRQFGSALDKGAIIPR